MTRLCAKLGSLHADLIPPNIHTYFVVDISILNFDSLCATEFWPNLLLKGRWLLKKLNFEQKIAIRVYIYFSLHCVFHASICVQLSKEPKTSIAFGFSQLHFLHRNRYYTIMNMLEIKATILGEKRKWNQFFFHWF